jgi:hypothetical protein
MPSTINTSSTPEVIENKDKTNKFTSPQQQKPLLSRDFESLTDIDEIRECLRLLDEEETRIDASLDNMLAQENKLDLSLNTLAVLR